MPDLSPLETNRDAIANRAIYLDSNASTPIDPRVLQVMQPFFSDLYANPSSTTHEAGRHVASAVERARADVAALIGAVPDEIVFTGGATESNNLAILGLAAAAPSNRRRVVTTQIEHKSVLAPVRELGRRGFDTSILGVDWCGRVDLDQLERSLRQGDVFLVSIQAANSEVGTRQDIPEVVRLAHKYGAAVHCDAVQAAGKVPVDVGAWGVDLMSFNAHKLYGPKGVGALFLSGSARSWPLQPLMFGGNQEFGLRPGTLDAPSIVGFGASAAIAMLELSQESERVVHLRDAFEINVQELTGGVVVNGDRCCRLPGTTSLTFDGIDAEALLARLSNVAASTSSACNSGALEPSHVLQAMGLEREDAYRTVRFAFGRFNTEHEVLEAARAVAEMVGILRKLGS